MSSHIERLIVKFITKTATSEDLDRLSEWIENPTNERSFRELVKTHYTITYHMNNPDTDKLVEQLLYKIHKKENLARRYKTKKVIITLIGTAAVLTGIFFSTNVLKEKHIIDKQEDVYISDNEDVMPGSNKATLTLADGTEIDLEANKDTQIANIKNTGKNIEYDASDSNVEEIEYNYLTIPRAGQYKVKLSDGTQIWLNSESQLKYPVKFSLGQTRKVELIYGEAYFDVTASELNDGSDFVVLNGSQEIEVLGTEFNVKAYQNETNSSTTLAEGSVSIKVGNTVKILKPEQQLSFNKNNGDLLIKTVDVYNETAWKDGVFSFEDKTLSEMMAVLSRWYDVNVIFENSSIEEEQFFGILRKNQTLDEILSSIKNFGIIKNYKITANEVTIQ